MNQEAEARNKRSRERRAASCVHFTGFNGDGACKAGIRYDSLGKPGLLPCIPAFRDAEAHLRPTCPKFEAMGMDRVLSEDAEFEVYAQNTNVARAAIMEKSGGSGAGAFRCPICTVGTLNYSIARCNGHVRAQCTTKGCVNWIE